MKRTLCALLLSSLMLAIFAPASAAPVAIRIGTSSTDVAGEPFYADATGAYRRHGLVAKVTAGMSGADVLEALDAGTIDIGFANVISVAGAIQKGKELVLLSPGGMYMSSRPAVTVLSQAAATHYTSGKDLEGKTVSTPGANDLGQVAVEAWIEKTGGDVSKVHFVHRLPMTKLAQYYAAHKIDAAEISEPVWTLERTRGHVKLLGDTFAAIAPALLIGGYVTTKAWAQAHPEAVRGFEAAMHETAVWANAHHAQTAPLLAARLKVDPAIVGRMVRATYALSLSPALIQPVLDAARKYGLIGPMQTADLVSGR